MCIRDSYGVLRPLVLGARRPEDALRALFQAGYPGRCERRRSQRPGGHACGSGCGASPNCEVCPRRP
eukprot:13775289-Alexandrium_andersonii.AAC.1